MLLQTGLLVAMALPQTRCFEVAVQFARAEGVVPAPKSSHVVWAAIDETTEARDKGEEPTILFCLSGYGHPDMQAYTYNSVGKRNDNTDNEYPQLQTLAKLPKMIN